MPRKGTRASRQSTRQRRPVTSTPRPATRVDGATETTANGTPTSDAGVTTATPGPDTLQARTPRRPATQAAAVNTLDSEQVRKEVGYIRGDLLRMLLITLIVFGLMVAAHFAFG